MAGRRGNVSKEEYNEIFNSFESQIIEDNKVVKPTSDIWTNINNNVLTKSNPKAIYSAAKRWFAERDDKSDSFSDFNDDCDNISIEMEHDESFNNSMVSNSGVDRINFNIHLSADVWKTIAPIPKRYERKQNQYYKGNGRQYFVLHPGVWSNVLIRISEHRKNIICNFVFKRNKVYVTGKFYVIVTGSCKSCGASITGFVKDKPKNQSDSVKFCFSLKNFNKDLHKGELKTVKNTGEKANAVFTSSKSALHLHQQMARTNTMFENPKGRQFTLNSIRCGKYRRKASKKITTCPYTAISYLQAMNCYANTIHFIGMSPFLVTYISPDQIRLYNAYKKKNPYTRLIGDSSGGFAHKLGKCPHNLKM